MIEFLKHSNWNSSKDSKDDGGTGNSSLSRSESSSLSRSDDRDLQNHSEHDNFNESSRDTSQVMKEEREEKLNSKNNRISNSVGYYNQRNAQGKFVKINLKTKVPDSQPDSTANVQPKRRGRKSLKTLQQDQLNEINKAKKMKYDLYEVSFDEDESSISDSSGEKDEPSRPRSEHHRYESESIYHNHQ